MTFLTEKESIDFICNYFEKKGYTATPTQEDNKYCHYDIELDREGKKIWLELKRRNFPSWQYGDAVIGEEKYNYFIWSKDQQLVDGVIIVSLFSDCFTLSNALHPVEFFKKRAKHKTEFNDKRIVTKKLVRYNQDIKIKYE